MNLKKEYEKLPKDIMYGIYEALVYETKDYDNITRSKMLDEIIKEYEQEDYLYDICTDKELSFLKMITTSKKTFDELREYNWEMNELNNKCIFSLVTLEVFEEQKENVRKALETFSENKHVEIKNAILFLISLVRIHGNLLTKSLYSMANSLWNINQTAFHAILGNPIFHFYCGFYDQYMEIFKKNEEHVYYRKYFDVLDELDELRKNYSAAGNISINFEDNLDIFYYGFPIQNPKVKKMYDKFLTGNNKFLNSLVIEEVRLLNNQEFLKLIFPDEHDLKIICEALDECPSGVLNGLTPNQYKKMLDKKETLDLKYTVIPQHNAHICKRAADEYYKVYFGLLEFVNQKAKVNLKIEKIYQQERLNPNDLIPINDYLWEHRDFIFDFIKENPYHFNEEELEIVNGFQNAVSDLFVLVGFDREYTMFLSEDGKMYMVKGVRDDIDKILDTKSLPYFVKTTLLMFKGNIIYNGFFEQVPISFGNNFQEKVIEDMNQAIKYYHL